MREYRRVPALESGSKLSNPDLQSIGEKNYTDIILRYGSLTTKFPQLNTNAKTIVAAINELYAHPGGSTVIPNPPVGSGIELEQGGSLELEQGGVLDTEQGGGTPVGDLTSISIDGDIYTIAGGGGGTAVVPNPPGGVIVADLTSIGIDNDVYAIPTGSTVVPNGGNYNNHTLNTVDIDNHRYIASGFETYDYITLYADNWAWDPGSHRYIQAVSGLNLANATLVFVGPFPLYHDNYTYYCECGVYGASFTPYEFTFAAITEPTRNLIVSISYCKARGRTLS